MDGHDQVIKTGNGDRFYTVHYKDISEKSEDLDDKQWSKNILRNFPSLSKNEVYFYMLCIILIS